MSKKNAPSAAELNENNGGPLPGEIPDLNDLDFGTEHGDADLFVRLQEPGETFTGVFLRKVEKGGNEDLKYPGLLFAQYPGGELKVLPDNWSLAEEVANQEQQEVDLSTKVMMITLREIKKKNEGTKNETSVKLYVYRYATVPPAFPGKIQWNEQFQNLTAKGK